jgi:hypothetical protein
LPPALTPPKPPPAVQLQATEPAADANQRFRNSTADIQLSREIALLDQARGELARGNAAAALATLAQRERELSRRVLEPEAVVVRVQALLASGQRARATAIAEAAIATEPGGSYAQRLRRTLNAKMP